MSNVNMNGQIHTFLWSSKQPREVGRSVLPTPGKTWGVLGGAGVESGEEKRKTCVSKGGCRVALLGKPGMTLVATVRYTTRSLRVRASERLCNGQVTAQKNDRP